MIDKGLVGAEFDEYAAGYDKQLAQGLSLSGEDKHYFARGRIAWLCKCLRYLKEYPKYIMDFGCGNGATTTLLLQMSGVKSVVGLDSSKKNIETASNTILSKRIDFKIPQHYSPVEKIDLVYCNGVFHHIPTRTRPAVLGYIRRSLRPQGLFAFWENNPWNPGTRLIMRRIPFDRNAILLAYHESQNLLKLAGFEILRTDFQFIFPGFLRWFRFLEPRISRLPLGAQYQILSRKI